MHRCLRSIALAGLFALAWADASATEAPPSFEPTPCEFADAPAGWFQANGVRCGWVRVPAHHDAPAGPLLKLHVVRIPAARGAGRSPLPLIRVLGGPLPMSATDFTGPRTTRLRKDRDVVFFDYRGTGRSEPALACNTAAVAGATTEARLAAKVRQFADCRAQVLASGADLSAISTREFAHDVNAIALALGYTAYAVDGGSYGSRVLFELLRQRPAQLRAAVIGAPMVPNSAAYDTPSAFAVALQRVQQDCGRTPACAQCYPDLVATLEQALQRFDRETLRYGERRLVPADLFTALSGLAADDDFQRLPSAIDFAAHGDAGVLARWVGATSQGVEFAAPDIAGPALTAASVTCADLRSGGAVAPRQRAAAQRYPFLRRALEPADAADRLCAAWETKTALPPLREAVSSDVPVLMYSMAFDPTSLPEDARLAARTLPKATLLEHPGGSHRTLDRDPCMIELEAAFLSAPGKPLERRCTRQWKPATFALDGFERYVESLQLPPG